MGPFSGLCWRTCSAYWWSRCCCHANWSQCSHCFWKQIEGKSMAHAYDFYKPNLASEYPVSCSVSLHFVSENFWLDPMFWKLTSISPTNVKAIIAIFFWFEKVLTDSIWQCSFFTFEFWLTTINLCNLCFIGGWWEAFSNLLPYGPWFLL